MKKNTTNPQNTKERSRQLSRVLFLLGRSLRGIVDPREPRGVRYALWQILAIVVLAKAAGQDTPFAIAQWAAERQEELTSLLGLKSGRVPHHTTSHRLLRRLPKEQIEAAVRAFTLALAQEKKPRTPHGPPVGLRWQNAARHAPCRPAPFAPFRRLLALVWGSLGQVQVVQIKEMKSARPVPYFPACL